MSHRFTFILALAAVSLFSGCATQGKMAFSDQSPVGKKLDKPVFLMTTTLHNAYRPAFQPKMIVSHVERKAAKDGVEKIDFAPDDKAKLETGSAEEGNSYLLRMELDQGAYVIRGFTAQAWSFPILGSFYAPLHSSFESGQPGVYYLGHVHSTVRERVDNEFKAGFPFPLIDQAVAGASTGTFDVIVSDQWEKDEPVFRARFPALDGVTVVKAILPSFDRNQAQKIWEEN